MNPSNSPSIFLSYLHSILASFLPLVGRYFTTFFQVLLNFSPFFPHVKGRGAFPRLHEALRTKPQPPPLSAVGSLTSCLFSQRLNLPLQATSEKQPFLGVLPFEYTFVLLMGKILYDSQCSRFFCLIVSNPSVFVLCYLPLSQELLASRVGKD